MHLLLWNLDYGRLTGKHRPDTTYAGKERALVFGLRALGFGLWSWV